MCVLRKLERSKRRRAEAAQAQRVYAVSARIHRYMASVRGRDLERRNDDPSTLNLIPFPAGAPKPHESRRWGRDLDAKLVRTHGLSSVARNKLPPGMFRKLWSKEALAPPPKLPRDADYRAIVAHRNLVDKIEERTRENAQIVLARTSHLALNYTGDAIGANQIIGRADSDWEVRRSTTGYCILLACAAIAHRSHRQHCIAMSSTEAEMMALAELALEVLYIRAVLITLGHEFSEDEDELGVTDAEAHRLVHEAQRIRHHATACGTSDEGAVDACKVESIKHGPIECATDNSGARDNTVRHTMGQHSRHVERKVKKMRELYHGRKVIVKLVPTADNVADMLTKVLDDKTFAKHRRTIMNLAAQCGL